ncbi:hypothetical protein VPG91_12905 [Nitrospirillum amazonense]|uniref:hypothetical protein n=1 Tax=Nitrospirillum amazonense TaxID=28077 RepID=UPI002DD4313A|nr:hypothetical protein [Nitrospirillum amazonense]MEC4591890.1 hypothetical protein [Nitrospirillum amazonense]
MDDVGGETIADYIEEILVWNMDVATWNSVTDLRLHVGNVSPDAIRRMGAIMGEAMRGRSGGRAAVVSHNAGLRFLLNLARVFIPGHELRAFSDMATAYAWAAGQKVDLPAEMATAGWGRVAA